MSQVPNKRRFSEYSVPKPVIKSDDEYMSMDQTDDHNVSIMCVPIYDHKEYVYSIV